MCSLLILIRREAKHDYDNYHDSAWSSDTEGNAPAAGLCCEGSILADNRNSSCSVSVCLRIDSSWGYCFSYFCSLWDSVIGNKLIDKSFIGKSK